MEGVVFRVSRPQQVWTDTLVYSDQHVKNGAASNSPEDNWFVTCRISLVLLLYGQTWLFYYMKHILQCCLSFWKMTSASKIWQVSNGWIFTRSCLMLSHVLKDSHIGLLWFCSVFCLCLTCCPCCPPCVLVLRKSFGRKTVCCSAAPSLNNLNLCFSAWK